MLRIIISFFLIIQFEEFIKDPATKVMAEKGYKTISASYDGRLTVTTNTGMKSTYTKLQNSPVKSMFWTHN